MGNPRLREPADAPGDAARAGVLDAAGRRGSLRRRVVGSTKLGVGADTAVTTAMSVLTAAGNYAFRLVVLGAFTSKEEAGTFSLVIAYLAITTALADFGLNATVLPKIALARGADTIAFRAVFVMRMYAIAITWIGLNVYLLAVGRGEILGYVNLGFVGVLFSGRLTGVRQSLELLWRLKGRAYVSAAFTVFDSLLGLVVVMILAGSGTVSVGTVILVWTVTSLPGFVMLLVPLLPSLRAAGRLRQRVPARYYRRLLWTTLPVGLMGYAGQLSGQLETFILDLFGTRADVGAYNVAISPLMGLIFVPVAISVGLAPLVAQLFRGSRRDISMELTISLGVRAVLALGVMGVVAANVFAVPIMGLFDAAYAGDVYILRIYSVITALVFVVIANDQFLLAAGYRRQVATGAVLNLLLAIALEVPLVAIYGIRGIMVAKIVAIVATIAWQISAFRRDMRAGALHGLARMLGPIAVLAAGLALTRDWSLWPQAALLLPAVAASLLLFGALRRSELALVRGLRLS